MARVNRHYIPGCICHITHRCHKKEFLLKFARDRSRVRNEAWTESVAVGSAAFVARTREILGARGKGRVVDETGDAFVLREKQEAYGRNFSPESRPIGPNNTYFWSDFP